MRSALSLALAGLLVLSAVAAVPTAGAAAAGVDAPTNSSPTTDANTTATDDVSNGSAASTAGASNHDACAALADDPRENPDTDSLGWENGCWANETLSVTRGDGLNETELDAVVGRSMARVERVRGLEFETSVPVEVISREQLRERRGGSGNDSATNTSTANRLHQNVKWEAMLSIGEDEDALSTFQSTQTATIGGFYNYEQDRIVIVSENATSPKMDEITLSQELFHALQDQRLAVSYNRSTREGNNAALGIVEGDGNLVDRRYQLRCESGEWDCLMPEASGGGGGSSDINYGVYLTQFQPYSDGPKFVRGIYNEGGWDAVNAVYENPPTSTEQVIHPEKYPDEGSAEISFEDTSSDEWTIPDLGNGSVDYARFGQAGLSAMFMRPVFESGGNAEPVVTVNELYNLTAAGQPSEFDPLNYGLSVTDGWENDRLYPYVTDDSATSNETGYVWKTLWENGSEASEFSRSYLQLLVHYGAEEVEGRENTYRIPDEEPFGDAFAVRQQAETLVIVNAPTVEALSEVRDGAGAQTPTETPPPTDGPNMPTTERNPGTDPGTTATDSPTDMTAPTPTDEPAAAEGTTSTDGPGFGALAAVLALVALVVGSTAVVRRREGR
jgi:hypothetical protein